MNKKQVQSEATRRKISEAARNLFIQKGYKATSIEDIVAATDSSKGNIYYHFQSKEGLFLYLINEWDRDWLEKWNEKVPSYPTITAKLFGLAEQIVKEDMNHPLLRAADEFFSNDEKKSEVEEKISNMMEEHLEFNRKLIREGIESGEFAEGDIPQKAIVLESILIGLDQLSRNEPIEVLLERYRFAMQIFLHGIAGDPVQA